MAPAKKKVPRRKHTRAKIAPIDANDTAAVARRDKEVRRFNDDFVRSLPQDPASGQNAMHGGYTQAENDRFDGRTYDNIPDGTYRVAGSDWVFVFEGGGFVEAMQATEQNGYGGKDVISIDAPPNG